MCWVEALRSKVQRKKRHTVGKLAVIKIMHDKKMIIESQKLMNLAKLLRVPLALVNGC
jgi:hypothetical protein